MSNGDSITQDQLEGLLENAEATPGWENDPQVFQLRVLHGMWIDVTKIKDKQEEIVRDTEENPSLMYLIRYHTVPTLTNIFFVGLIMYIVYSGLDVLIGWQNMLGAIIP